MHFIRLEFRPTERDRKVIELPGSMRPLYVPIRLLRVAMFHCAQGNRTALARDVLCVREGLGVIDLREGVFEFRHIFLSPDRYANPGGHPARTRPT